MTKITTESAAKRQLTDLQNAIVDGLEDVKAQNIQIFDTADLSPLFERVIVASATSSRQTKALSSSVREKVKEAGFPVPRTEGEENGEWIIVDAGMIVVHIMQPAIREYYRLEEIWGVKPVKSKSADKKAAVKAAKAATADTEEKPKAKTKAKAEKSDKPAAAKKPAAKKSAAGTDKPAVKKTAAAKKAPAEKKAVVKKIVTKKAVAKKTTAKTPAKKTTKKVADKA